MCGSERAVKNGFVTGIQRYKCKECSANFIDGDKRKKYGAADRLKVIKLYLENCGIRTIERLTGIRNSQISIWIEEAAEKIKQELTISRNSITSLRDISILEIDELCTYIKKDQKTVGNSSSYGLLLIDNQVKLLTLK
jgi:transposase-like protein